MIQKMFFAALILFFMSSWENSSAYAKVIKKMNIYVIHSYLPGLWSKGGNRGVENALKYANIRNGKVKVHDYNYVTERPYKDKEIAAIEKEIDQFQADLIILFDDEATEDFIGVLNKKNIPIVATGINKEIKDMSWYLSDGDPKRNFSAILERYPFEQPLQLLKKINKNINQISILTSANLSSKVIKNQMKAEFKRHGGGFAGIRLKDTICSKNWKDWKKAIVDHQARNEALWILVPWDVYDENGNEVKISEISSYYAKNSKIPDLGIVSSDELMGNLASFSVSSEDLGFEAALLGINAIKSGKPLRDYPFRKVKTTRVIINKARADHLGYRIPLELLEFATVEKKIPVESSR